MEEQSKCKQLLTSKFQPASEIDHLGMQMYLHECTQIIAIIMWITFFCEVIADPFAITPKHSSTAHLWGGWLFKFHFRVENTETTWLGTFQRPSLTFFTCLAVKSNLITSVSVLYLQTHSPFLYLCLALPVIPNIFFHSSRHLVSVSTKR